MEQWELEVRELVRDTVSAYAHAVDGGRFDDLVALFTADGVLEIQGESVYAGRDAIRGFATGVGKDLAAATDVPRIRHFTANLRIEVDDPNAARAQCYFLALTERGVDHWGRYRDQLVRSGDRFLFSRRSVRTDGAAPGSWVAQRSGR
jgi:3-phenylpropionate/cinnamic acid dioxygenase small subunit